MFTINPDKEKFIRSLQELEFEFERGNLSKNSYNSQKKRLTNKIETIEIANRVKKLQGKEGTEQTLDHWQLKKNKDKVQEDKEEKEELMRKYMTSTKNRDLRTIEEKKRGINRSRTILATVLALLFFSGIAFGFLIINSPTSSAVPMTVNQSAFSTANNTTNITANTTSSNNTPSQTSQSTQTTNTNTGTSTTNTGSNTGSGNSGANTTKNL